MIEIDSWRGLIAVLVFLSLSVLIGILYAALGLARGWRPWPTVIAGLALAIALIITLTPSEWGDESSIMCSLSPPSKLGLFVLPALTQESLNALLLIPFGLFSTLAARQVWVSALWVIVTPSIIELIQAFVPALDRICTLQDIADNITGGLLGVLLGALVVIADRWQR